MTFWIFFKLLKILIFHWNELLKTSNVKQKQKRGFLEMLLGTSGASLLRNMLTGKGIVRADYGLRKWIVRAGYGKKEKDF